MDGVRSRGAASLRSLAKLIRLGDWKASDLEDAANEAGEALAAVRNAGVDKPTERLINGVVSHLNQFTKQGRELLLMAGVKLQRELASTSGQTFSPDPDTAARLIGLRDLTPSYCNQATDAFDSLASELDTPPVAEPPANDSRTITASGASPLTQYVRVLVAVPEALRRRIERDKYALELLSAEHGLLPSYARAVWREEAARECLRTGRLVKTPRIWTRCDERVVNQLRGLVPEGVFYWDENRRLSRYLTRISPRSGPSPHDTRFRLAFDEARRDGTAAVLGPKLDAAKGLYDRLLAAAHTISQGDDGFGNFDVASVELGNLAGELMAYTKPVAEAAKTAPDPPNPQPAPAASDNGSASRRKPGPTPEPEEEKRRYRVLVAWNAYRDAPDRKGKVTINVDFLDWCDRKRHCVPHPEKGAPMTPGSDWHKGIASDIAAVKRHLKRSGLTLEAYGNDLTRRKIL